MEGQKIRKLSRNSLIRFFQIREYEGAWAAIKEDSIQTRIRAESGGIIARTLKLPFYITSYLIEKITPELNINSNIKYQYKDPFWSVLFGDSKLFLSSERRYLTFG